MKKLIAIIVLSMFASTAFADESGNSPAGEAAIRDTEHAIYLSRVQPDVVWAGVAAGTHASFGVNGGTAWRVNKSNSTVRMAAGVAADLISIDGKVVLLPQGTFMFATENSPAFLVRTGYSPRTGATIGADVCVALPLDTVKTISARAGVTAFEKSVGGSRGVFQVGLVRNF